nr:septal ring lytic transglycosylase RlpA family protein [Lentzea flaviverrucosa]
MFAFSGTNSNAAEDCGGLDTALQNNLNFIAGQQANPDAQSDARIQNRQQVVSLINQRRAAAGCGNNVQAKPEAGQAATSGEDCGGLDKALQNNLSFIAGQKSSPDSQSEARIANRQAVVDLIQQRRKAAGCKGDGGAAEAGQGNANQGNQPTAQPTAQPTQQPDANQGDDNGATGQQVCNGSTVTLSGEGGAPAASSGTFPIGTTLKVTNLDNNKSTTVKVASASGSCALLNNAAFEQVREPGKFLIRNARIEKIG